MIYVYDRKVVSMADGMDVMLQEILKRSSEIRRKRERRFLHAMTGLSCVLIGALAVLIPLLSGAGPEQGTPTVMGSFILSAQAGGYILVAVIAFVLGIIAAIITERYRKRNDKGKGT